MHRHANVHLARRHDRRPNTVQRSVRRDPNRSVCPGGGRGGGLRRRGCAKQLSVGPGKRITLRSRPRIPTGQRKAAALVFRGITFRRRAPSPGGLCRTEPPLALLLAISHRALPPLDVICRRGGHGHRSRRGLHHRRPYGRLGNRNTRPLSRQTGSGNPRIFAGAEHTPAPATTAPRLVGRIHT